MNSSEAVKKSQLRDLYHVILDKARMNFRKTYFINETDYIVAIWKIDGAKRSRALKMVLYQQTRPGIVGPPALNVSHIGRKACIPAKWFLILIVRYL